MAHRATQQINSAFGTWYPGETLSDVPAPVIETWLAADIAEVIPGGDVPAANDPADPAGEAATRPVERATAQKRETTAGRRMQTEPPPHRRFTPKDA